jgi:hypothetical protein
VIILASIPDHKITVMEVPKGLDELYIRVPVIVAGQKGFGQVEHVLRPTGQYLFWLEETGVSALELWK